MAVGDNRKTIQIADLDLQKINTALAQLSDWVMRLEGRSGGINLRDSVTIQSDKQSLIDFESSNAGKASIAVFGVENATLAFAKGSRKENNGDWVATDTVSVIWALDRAGNGTLYVNTGLVEGQAFSPTVSFVVGSGGSVTPHVLDSSTHTVSGKTAGHVLQALSATTFGFAALSGLNVTNTPAGGIAATTVQAAINELDTEKANLASPTFTGTPAAPTAAVGTSTTQLATTAFVDAEAVAKAGDTMTGTLRVPKLEVDDAAFYLDSDATGPVLAVDTNDFYQYNRAGNTHGFYVGSSRKLGFDANYFLVGPTNPGGFLEAGVASPPTVGATTPAWNCYAKPVAGQWRANSSTAITYAGTAGYAIIWGGNQFDYSNGRIALVTIASVANAGFQVTEAGVYRWSFISNAEMVAGATYTIYATRLNSASSGGLVEYCGLGSVKNWNATATHYHNIAWSGTVLMAANEYLLFTHGGVGNMVDANWNTLSIERIN
jgi:hypothetical protein